MDNDGAGTATIVEAAAAMVVAIAVVDHPNDGVVHPSGIVARDHWRLITNSVVDPCDIAVFGVDIDDEVSRARPGY